MTLRIPSWAFPAAVVLVGFSGWLAVHQWKARIEADALAELRTAQADSMAVALEVSDRRATEARAALDSTRAAADRQVAEARGAELVAESRVRAAGRTLDATLDSLQLLASDSAGNLTGNLVADVRAQLAAERQAHTDVAVALRAQVDGLSVSLATADSTVAILEGQVRERDVALAAERELRIFFERQQNPEFFAKVRSALPVALGAAAVAVVAWEIARE